MSASRTKKERQNDFGAGLSQKQKRELAEARWFDRTEVPVMDDNTSLTSAMVRAFAEGKEREYHGG